MCISSTAVSTNIKQGTKMPQNLANIHTLEHGSVAVTAAWVNEYTTHANCNK